MKTKFASLVVSILAVFCISGQATTLTSTREIYIKNKTRGTVTRSGITLPIRAFIDGTIITVEFAQSTPYAVLSVINRSTGEVLYTEAVINFGNLSFDLSGEESGEYQLKLVIGDQELEGYFSILN